MAALSLDRLEEIAVELSHRGLCGSAEQVRLAVSEIRHLQSRYPGPGRNMYGVTACPKCGSDKRWPERDSPVTHCDDCGYSCAHVVLAEGPYFDDQP